MLASIKSNLAAPAPSLVFGLTEAPNGAVRVEWKGESNLDAATLLSTPIDPEEKSALEEAQDLLREILANGPVLARDAQDEARGAGIAERTLKRARSSLGVVAQRKGEPGQQGGGRWYWRLPEVKEAKPKGWHSKPAADRADSENTAYISQNGDAMLRGPSTKDVKGANGHGPLKTLCAQEVAEETRCSKSGPARALAAYLQKPTEERFEWLVRAVLTAKGMDTSEWMSHADVVFKASSDPASHPPDCVCEAC